MAKKFEKNGDDIQASPGHPGDFFKHPLPQMHTE